jgi:hypothetical protein
MTSDDSNLDFDTLDVMSSGQKYIEQQQDYGSKFMQQEVFHYQQPVYCFIQKGQVQ